MPLTYTPVPAESDALSVLRTFLLSILPAGIPVIQGQINRVVEPRQPDFVVFWPTTRTRLSTNVNTFNDCAFTADIDGTLMTVSAVAFGELQVGQTVFGVSVASNTVIAALGTGAGGPGTYTVSPSQVISSRTMASGLRALLQPTELNVQVDVHGHSGADNAQLISTLLRDEYGASAFAALSSTVSPLSADDPMQMPFTNAEQQWEDRWVVNVKLQANIVIEVPQQFADELTPTVIEVEAEYPIT